MCNKETLLVLHDIIVHGEAEGGIPALVFFDPQSAPVTNLALCVTLRGTLELMLTERGDRVVTIKSPVPAHVMTLAA